MLKAVFEASLCFMAVTYRICTVYKKDINLWKTILVPNLGFIIIVSIVIILLVLVLLVAEIYYYYFYCCH